MDNSVIVTFRLAELILICYLVIHTSGLACVRGGPGDGGVGRIQPEDRGQLVDLGK